MVGPILGAGNTSQVVQGRRKDQLSTRRSLLIVSWFQYSHQVAMSSEC
jgi:hypothetical protein